MKNILKKQKQEQEQLQKQEQGQEIEPRQANFDREKEYNKPHYEIYSQQNGFEVRVAMPGVEKSGVSLDVEDEFLTIKGTNSSQIPSKWTPLHKELNENDYRLKLNLWSDIDKEKINAKLVEGMLYIDLPLREACKPRIVPVK